eukprot:11570993-Alexandrium_andersonii.AAC.1
MLRRPGSSTHGATQYQFLRRRSPGRATLPPEAHHRNPAASADTFREAERALPARRPPFQAIYNAIASVAQPR